MIYELKGNLLEADNVDIICHQVNCQGKMNSGIAKAIREKYPEVYKDYMMWYVTTPDTDMLGVIQYVEIDNGNRAVINMASQLNYGYDGKRYTNYEAFWQCLMKIRADVPNHFRIGFPKGIGCARGGANWNVIRTMIEEALGDEFDVYIYELGEEK